MLDNESDQTPESDQPHQGDGDAAEQSTPSVAKKTARKTAAKRTAKKATAKKTTAKKTAQPAAEPAGESAAEASGAPEVPAAEPATEAPAEAAGDKPAKKTAAKKATKTAAKKTTKKAPAKKTAKAAKAAEAPPEQPPEQPQEETAPPAASLLFQAPDPEKATPRKRTRKRSEPAKPATDPAADPASDPASDMAEPASTKGAPDSASQPPAEAPVAAPAEPQPQGTPESGTDEESRDDSETTEGDGSRRRRRRGGRRRRKGGQGDGDQNDNSGGAGQQSDDTPAKQPAAKADETADDSGEPSPGSRRRRRRRRSGDNADVSTDDPANTVVRVREPRKSSDDEISGFTGSTRLEAKKQRRREGREAGRRRAPIVSEAEFLARRESVERTMVVRQHEDLTQIAVLEDKMLVEHYVARESQTSLIGNVYLGRVQNVLPSMEAAFIDIGKGRNAVLYAGEVNWSALGKDGQPRRIETALKSGQPVLVQVTKDPVGHKGARLTSQISLPGRYLVYVPGGQTSGISRKLPDTERNRLKNLLKEIIADEAGVIIRTAAEGASEEELRRDVARLTARWEDIEKKVDAGQAPALLYGEPDLTVKVIRDLFTEDFDRLVVSGDDAWDTIEGYVGHVAPDLMERVERWDGQDGDVFASYRVDEQIAKGLDRKVFLPSGGSLVIDRTEAMTVVDVNTGKFTGSGGNLEETVTKNNLEAAEEIVRQLRLRDIGGIIVVDFIDMVLESNRDLVLRRLIECLGRDRTKHQVAEVTSLGLVQMTRKRIGTGLVEAFSESCEHCAGRGVVIHHEPVEPKRSKRDDDDQRRGKRGRRRGGDGGKDQPNGGAGDQPKDTANGGAGDQPKEQATRQQEQATQQPEQQGQQEAKPRGRGKRSDRSADTKPDDAALDKKQGDKLATAVPADTAAPQPSPAEPAPAQAAQPKPAQPEPAPTAADEVKPKRTRRRAGRPQGQPDEQSTAPVLDASEPAAAEPTPAPAAAEPTSAPAAAEPAPAPAEPQPAPAPVTTAPTEPAPRRTRRRAASRPAGPPQ